MRSLTVPLAAGLLVGCVSQEDFDSSQRHARNLEKALADLAAYQRELEAVNAAQREELIRLGKSAADAEWIREQKQKLDRLIAEFQNGGSLAIAGVTAMSTPEGLAFQVQGGVLFESGKAELSAQGQNTLRQLIPTLQSAHRIRVDGHTDDEPIRHSGWKSNLDLSAARALSVAEFLNANGLREDLVSIGAFGEFQPAQPGSTPEAKRANRRVEILMVDR